MLLQILILLLSGQTPPPLPPQLPGRPPPLASGTGLRGVLGSDCQDRRDEAGRWSHTSGTTLSPGQKIWLSLSSPDFDARLEIVDPDGEVVAVISDTAGGLPTGSYFTAAGEPTSSGASLGYGLRITSIEPGQTGRWRVEDRRDGSHDPMFADVFPEREKGLAASCQAGS